MSEDIEQLRKDAIRYRWLRAHNWSEGGVTVADPEHIPAGTDTYSGDALDRVIDLLSGEPDLLIKERGELGAQYDRAREYSYRLERDIERLGALLKRCNTLFGELAECFGDDEAEFAQIKEMRDTLDRDPSGLGRV